MSLDLTEAGRYFYHYTRWSTASELIVPKRTLQLSPYSSMRDPLESQKVMLGAGVSYAPDDDEAQAELMRAHSEAQNLLDLLRPNSKLLSMSVDAEWVRGSRTWSERRFGMGWARARLWEFYAEGHTGVCLAFERDAFEELVLAQLQERSPEAKSGKVHYWRPDSGEWPWPTILLSRADTGPAQLQKHVARHFTEYFFTKLIDWEGEYEYRLVEPSETEGCSYVEFGETLVGMVVGHEFPQTLEPDAIALADEHNFDLRQVRWDLNGPSEEALKSQFSSESLAERAWLFDAE